MIIDEHTNLETVAALASFIIEHEELGAPILSHTSGDVDEASCLLEECCHGEYDSKEDFAISFVKEIMILPVHLEYYIDYEKMARDFVYQ